MNLLDRLKDDYKAMAIGKEHKIYEVNALGYLLSKVFIPIGSDPVIFNLVELLEEDTKKPTGLSYLYHIKSDAGFIMPRSYKEYRAFLREKDVS